MMKDYLQNPTLALAIAAMAGLTLAITSVNAQTTRYWSGTGNWDTSTAAWATASGGGYTTLWTGGDNATFEGTPGTVTLGEATSVNQLTFTAASLGTSQYIISGNILNFSGGGTITNLNATNAKIQTISSSITGAPAVNLITSSSGGDVTGGIKFAPTGGAVQHLGTATLAAGYPGSSGGADKTTLWLSGTTTGNTINAVDQNTKYSLIRKSDSGSWTVTGVAKCGRLYMDGGNLIVTGSLQGTQYQGIFLNSGTLHYNNPGAVRNTTEVGQAWTFAGGSLDNSSGAAITSSTYDPSMIWNANVSFIGSNGAASDLHLGNGSVTLTGNRTVTVQNAAATLTVGGVISGSGLTLTKAGPGTLALNGVNSYTGPTMLNQGTLRVDGSIDAASTVTVNTGMLSGTGSIQGMVAVPSPATLFLTNTGGTLNVGSVVVDGTLNFEMSDLDDEADGAMAVTDDLDLTGATLHLNITAGTVQTGYVIATYGSLTGSFSSITGLPVGWAIDYAYNTGDAIAIVPPAPVAPPTKPTGLTATSAISEDGSTSFVKLDWNASSGAAGYIVKRSDNSGGPYAPIATTRFKTYNDADVVVAQTYYYVISAENSFAEGLNSDEVNAVPTAPPPPPAPSGLAATTVNGLMSLGWNATPATSGYLIRRATSSGGPCEEIGTTTTNNFLVSSGVVGTTYFYVVAAMNSGGGSGDSNEVSALFSGDPLIVAVDQLKSHITGTAPLTASEIEQASLALKSQANRFAESADSISAVFDLVSTYDSVNGPLWIATGNLARASETNDLTWTIYRTMQSIMDVVYQAATLADPLKLAVIENYRSPGGFMFGSSARFPGPCAPPANPSASHTVAIQGSFDVTSGRNTQGWTNPARKPTGCYLAPATTATVTVPASLVSTGYQIRVGAHSWDLSNRPELRRLDRATLLYPINATTVKVASPYGGGIYIEVPLGASAGVVNVTVTGAVRSPYFSAKSFHQTTPAEWLIERTHSAPWADFQSDKFMTQVPTSWIYAHPDPAQMMADWDAAMDAINDLMGFPHSRSKETMYPQVDIIMRSSVHAPGYPAVNVTDNPNNDRGGYFNNYIVRGPGASATAAHIEFHEQGHAYGFPKFGGETESNVNLLQPAMLNRAFGYSLDVAQGASLGSGNTSRTLDNTAVAWMCVFNFSPREVPMASGEKAYQHKGHAKFMDVARLYGWNGLDAYWRSFMEDDANSISYGTGTDDLLLRLSRHVGKDIRPLFHFWGIYPQNPTTLANAIAAENIPADPAIRDLLLHYNTLVPADNTAFRTFAQAWWGKQPSINGYWEEREHARQWDTTALYGVGDQQRSEATNPGEIYNGNSANDITTHVQELVDLYFTGEITPDPMTFAILAAGVDETTIGMVATTASASSGPIQYYFENITAGTNSSWITNTSWQSTGLASGTSYDFRVKARDGALNETGYSSTASATTIAPDTTAPSPDPMSFAGAPTASGETSITMTAATATDPSGVEYFFECSTVGGNNSLWQDRPTYTDTALTAGTEYTYRVRARDKSVTQTATGWSGTASATTALPDTTAPTPDPMSFSSPPAALGSTSITMTAATATDPSGVEYFFECTAGGGQNSLWQDAATYIDTELPAGVEYTYHVRARDKSTNQNATDWSAQAVATTSTTPSTLYTTAGGAPFNWNNSATVWGVLSGGPYNTAVWSSGDAAVFEGTPATVTPSGPVTLGDFTFSPTSGSYTISGSTLNFTPGATIRNNDHRVDQTITSAITGSPAVHIKDYNPTETNNTYLGIKFAPLSGTQTLGAVLNPDNTGNKDKAGVTFAGSTAGNTVASISYAGGDKYSATNFQSGEWSVLGNITTGTVKVTGGTHTFSSTVRCDYNEFRATGGTVKGNFTIFTNDRRNVPYIDNGATISPGNSIGTITLDWGTSGTPLAGEVDYSFIMKNGSTYEWEVGAANATDTIHLVEGRLYLKNFTLKIIDSGGTPSPTDQLPVFTYASGVTRDLSGFTHSFVLPSRWSGTPSLVDDGAGTIYLTGIEGSGGVPYHLWSGGPFQGTLGNNNASLDFDSGGLETGIEWVVGGDPTKASDDTALAPTFDNTIDPDYFIFTYRRSDAADADTNTTITAQYGVSPDSWANASHDGTNIIITESNDSYATGIDKVEVKIKKTLAPDGKLFARLNVVVVP
jgi:autotransporter-associated beta strand protein